jgi:nucleoside-diphosphate-sugar epimerase
MPGRRALVFGASGCLGSAATRALAAQPGVSDVVRVTSRAGGEAAGRPGWVRHDLVADPVEALAGLVADVRPDVVLSCVGRLSGSVGDLVTANVVTTARLVDAVLAAAPSARLVVLGSAAEYGVVRRGRPSREDDPVDPVGEYGVTKRTSTDLVRCAARDRGLDGVVLRVFNPVGAGLPAESVLGRAAASLRAAQATGAGEIRLGPLGACRDFVDVRDVASAVTAAALAEAPDVVLNVGSGVATLVRRAVQGLADVAGWSGTIHESAPAPSRSAPVDWIAADLTRVRRSLGWEPVHDLDASLKDVWAA